MANKEEHLANLLRKGKQYISLVATLRQSYDREEYANYSGELS